MSDELVRAISSDGMVKATAVSTRALTERARNIHHTLPVATAALGRALAAASMMGNALKEEGSSVTLQFRGDGPLGTVLAVSDNLGNVRGTVDNPTVDLPLRPDGKLNVGAGVGGEGTLTVIRDLNLKEPYVGTVGLLGGDCRGPGILLCGVRADSHGLRIGRAGGSGPECEGGRRLSDSTAARRRRGGGLQSGGQPDGRRSRHRPAGAVRRS